MDFFLVAMSFSFRCGYRFRTFQASRKVSGRFADGWFLGFPGQAGWFLPRLLLGLRQLASGAIAGAVDDKPFTFTLRI
jgi:hypothetical protein